MKKTTTLIVMAVLCLIFNADAQKPNPAIKPLNVGDQLPEAIWDMSFQVVNHKEGKKTISLKEHKGKLIIIDFWTTSCSVCINAMPNLHQLEKQFSDNMISIGATHENREKITSFISANKTLKALKTYSIVQDTLLKKFFPHRLVPHYVWIGHHGLIEAITSADQITAENVTQVINEVPKTIETKMDLNVDRPLFMDERLSADQIQHYSILVKGLQHGLGSGMTRNPIGNTTSRICFSNSPILTMYVIAAGHLFKKNGQDFHPSKRLIIASSYPDRLTYSPPAIDKKNWSEHNLYTYDLVIPFKDSENLYQYLLEGLNRYSDFIGQIEKRRTKCLVLIKKNKNKTIVSSSAKSSYPLQIYANVLDSKEFIPIPILNETGINDEVRLLKSESENMKTLLDELHALNLDLKEVYREIDFLVIRDKKAVQLSTQLK